MGSGARKHIRTVRNRALHTLQRERSHPTAESRGHYAASAETEGKNSKAVCAAENRGEKHSRSEF